MEQEKVVPWKPKDFKELTEWFVNSINSKGSATKRDFLNHANSLLNEPEDEGTLVGDSNEPVGDSDSPEGDSEKDEPGHGHGDHHHHID